MPEQTLPIGWGVLIILAYPLLTLVFSEWSRRQAKTGESAFAGFLRIVQTQLLPTIAIWLVVEKLANFDRDSLPTKLANTALGIAILYALFTLARNIISTARTRTPRLLYDIALSILITIGSAIIISRVWGFELSSLLSAVGVGSVVMGLALQNVISGMVSGLLLISARQFSIGDFLNAGPGKTGLVKEVDWRTVTLEVSPTERIILPSASLTSALTSSSFSVTDTTKPADLSIGITIGYGHPPEVVRAMLIEIACSVTQLVEPDNVNCRITEYASGGIQYTVYIPVQHPGMFSAARDDFFSRLWYVAQRHAISIAPNPNIYTGLSNLPRYGCRAEDRAQLLKKTNAFRCSPEQLAELAQMGRLERWRTGESVLQMGAIAHSVWVVLNGSVCIFTPLGSELIELEHLVTGQVLAIREGFRNLPSPVLAIVKEESELLSLPIPVMEQLFNKDPGFAADIESILEARSQALHKLNTRRLDATTI
jgi:small-conductance mechanosensitive channel/CRP-like cAMP-binding protein